MGLRVLLVASAIVLLFFGCLALFFTDTAIQSFQLGEPDVPSRLLARNLGVALLVVAAMNLLSLRDLGSPSLRVLLTGNLLLNIGLPLADLTEDFPVTGDYWFGVAIHVIFIAGFGYYLLKIRGLQT